MGEGSDAANVAHDLGALVAYVGLADTEAVGVYAGWARIPEELVGQRQPELEKTGTFGRLVLDIGCILCQPSAHHEQYEAVLLRDYGPHVTGHTLVHKRSRRSALLGTAEAAVRDASPIVAARGAVPAGYAWAPEIETGVDKWSTMRWGWHGARLFWRGCAGQWIIGEYHDAVGRRHIFVRRNQRMYSDASGAKPRFTAYEDAKAYCETIDAHWPRTRKPV